MATLEEAKAVKRKYSRILNKLRIAATCGTTPNAGSDYIRKITEYEQTLKDMGFRTTDEYEDGVKPGTVVPITEEWKKAQWEKMSEVDRLFAQARKMSPKEGMVLIHKALSLIASGCDPKVGNY